MIESLKKDANNFLLNNKKRYEVISTFIQQIQKITEDSYPEIISYIEENSKIFFKDNSSSVFFIYNAYQYAMANWTKYELIFDILYHFLPQFRNCNITDYDFIAMAQDLLININFLFLKKIISIDSIVQKSYNSTEIFIFFLPEIEQYDEEYAEKRENALIIKDFFTENSEQLKKLYDLVKTDPEQHIINRAKCYHPSLLHKSIRDDDIDTFQSLLSQNNFDVNYRFEFSFYERLASVDDEPSLIQVAAIYGSLKIFKFLWMQKNIYLPKNLLSYAISGQNYEIVHICEVKCSCEESLKFSLMTGDQNLIDYFLENYSDKFEMNENDHAMAMKLKKIDFECEKYNDLSFMYLVNAVRLMNIKIIVDSLYKILYIVENFDNFPTALLISNSVIDFPLFVFLFSHKNEKCLITDALSCLFDSACNKGAFYVIEYLLPKLNLKEFKELFNHLSVSNHLATLVLNRILQLMNSHDDLDEKIVDSYILNIETTNDFFSDVDCFDVDFITKYLKVDDVFSTMECLFTFMSNLQSIASNKMVIDLFDKIIDLLQNDELDCFISLFSKYGYKQASDFIVQKMKEKNRL